MNHNKSSTSPKKQSHWKQAVLLCVKPNSGVFCESRNLTCRCSNHCFASFQCVHQHLITLSLGQHTHSHLLWMQVQAHYRCTILILQAADPNSAGHTHTLPERSPPPPRQLRIQDNRFQEYVMKSLQWISIFYQPSRRHAENNPNNMRGRVKPAKV